MTFVRIVFPGKGGYVVRYLYRAESARHQRTAAYQHLARVDTEGWIFAHHAVAYGVAHGCVGGSPMLGVVAVTCLQVSRHHLYKLLRQAKLHALSHLLLGARVLDTLSLATHISCAFPAATYHCSYGSVETAKNTLSNLSHNLFLSFFNGLNINKKVNEHYSLHPFFLQGTIRGSLLPSFKTPKNSVSRSWYGAGTERVRSRSFSKSDRYSSIEVFRSPRFLTTLQRYYFFCLFTSISSTLRSVASVCVVSFA